MGRTVTGAATMPLSARLTRSHLERLRVGVEVLVEDADAPSRAIVIAVRASVTESIAADTSGTLSSMDFVSRERVSTSFGSTSL